MAARIPMCVVNPFDQDCLRVSYLSGSSLELQPRKLWLQSSLIIRLTSPDQLLAPSLAVSDSILRPQGRSQTIPVSSLAALAWSPLCFLLGATWRRKFATNHLDQTYQYRVLGGFFRPKLARREWSTVVWGRSAHRQFIIGRSCLRYHPASVGKVGDIATGARTVTSIDDIYPGHNSLSG